MPRQPEALAGMSGWLAPVETLGFFHALAGKISF